jgi:drug/metabolite transporter (DMT)-like permease
MIFLILSILSSSLIYISFKIASHLNVKIFPVIVINYLTAALTGYIFSNHLSGFQQIISEKWFYASVILGILFIVMFYLIGLSTTKAGMTLTTISTKMSVVIPILFSIVYYNEKMGSIKIAGIFLAIFAILLSSLKEKKSKHEIKRIVFPLILFIGMGIVDSLVKFNQEEYLQKTGEIESALICFSTAAIIGIIFLSLSNNKQLFQISKKSIFIGLMLGLSNFGSLLFLVKALNSNFSDSSIIFALNNTIIIIITALSGKFVFNEKLNKINWLGLLISIIAIVLLSI